MGNKVSSEEENPKKQMRNTMVPVSKNKDDNCLDENNTNRNALKKNLFGEESKLENGSQLKKQNTSNVRHTSLNPNAVGQKNAQNCSPVPDQQRHVYNQNNNYHKVSSPKPAENPRNISPASNPQTINRIIQTLSIAQNEFNQGCEYLKMLSYSEALTKYEQAQENVLNVYPLIEDINLRAKVDDFILRIGNAIDHVNALLKQRMEIRPISYNKPEYKKEEIKQIFSKANASGQKQYIIREIPKKNTTTESNSEKQMRAKSSNQEKQVEEKKVVDKTEESKSQGNSGKSNIPQDLLEKIYNEIIDTKPNIKFDDVIGLDSAKQTLKEIIIIPNLRPDLFVGLRAPPRGLLLFGPPGTGKTMIAKAVATECKCTFFSITASSLTSKYLGESEKLVKALFHIAFEKQPSVIFIDEIDSILSKRTEGENDAVKRLKTEFLVQFEGVGSDMNAKVLVIGATNRPFELDNAVLRRLPKKIYVGPFNLKERVLFIKQIMKSTPHELTDKDMILISQQCENYSNSDLKELCKEAAYEPIRDLKDINNIKNVKSLRNVNANDFKKALRAVRGTLSKEILQELEQWNSNYGAIG